MRRSASTTPWSGTTQRSADLVRSLVSHPREGTGSADAPYAERVNTMRNLLLLAAATAVLILAFVASAGLRGGNQAAVSPSPSATATPSTPTPTASPLPTASPSPSSTAPAAGAITGRFGYPSDFIPPLTVYAIRVDDPKVFFSLNYVGYGNPPRPTPPPGVPVDTYTLTGIAPGTYYVIAYRNDGETSLGVYSRHTVNCLQATTGGQNSTPAPSCAANDHSLVPVTVRAGETVGRIDMTDWVFGQQTGTYPARPR